MTVNNKRITNSQTLKEETEHEFGISIIESNSGSTRYSSRDKSYSNLFDFFLKLRTTQSDERKTGWGRLSTKEKTVAVFKAGVALCVIVAFIAFVTYAGGRIGLIVGVSVVFATWFLVKRLTEWKHEKE